MKKEKYYYPNFGLIDKISGKYISLNNVELIEYNADRFLKKETESKGQLKIELGYAKKTSPTSFPQRSIWRLK